MIPKSGNRFSEKHVLGLDPRDHAQTKNPALPRRQFADQSIAMEKLEKMMDTQELHDRGLALRAKMLGRDAVEKRMNSFGDFGKPLQHIINAYVYGDVWNRSALPLATKSLAMVAMMAAAGHANELRVHLKGALQNGCSVGEIQEILLLVAMYCGIPAANDAFRVAADVLREAKQE
jgi:4-carboxymuconolactone decarboxylase